MNQPPDNVPVQAPPQFQQQPPAYGVVTQLRPGVITKRNPGTVLLLSIVTCGIYHLWWLFKTSDELSVATGDTSINATTDLLLVIVTCGIWGLFMLYRNTQKVQAVLAPRYPARKDQTQTVLMLVICSFFAGITALIAQYVVQEEYNALADAAG